MKNFTFKYIQSQYEAALSAGYQIMSMIDFIDNSSECRKPIIVNRIDIDENCSRAEKIAKIFNNFGIKGTFFVRLHAKEYNPFSLENYRILKFIKESGHELGYHSEVMEQVAVWNEDPDFCFRKDIEVFNLMFDIDSKGTASHGGVSMINNLDFWNNRKCSDFNLRYEAYENSTSFNLFHNSLYVSDSEVVRWKCYKNGVLVKGDNRDLAEHIKDKPRLIYLLIHPDTYYNDNIYE